MIWAPTWAPRSKASPRAPSAPMYHAQPVAAADGKCSASFSGLLPNPPVATTTAPAVMASSPTATPMTAPSSVSSRSTRWPERDVDVRPRGSAGRGRRRRPGPAPIGHVDPRHPLLAAEDQLVVVLDAEVAQPLHRRAGQLAEPADDAGVDVPAVELHVVVEQRRRRRRRCRAPSGSGSRRP